VVTVVKVSAWAGTRIGRAGQGSNRRDPPGGQRGITVSSVYVRPDGTQLRRLARQFGDGQLEIPVAASYRLADAAQALAQVAGSHAAGAVVLTP
jgi:NADPH:quinone reductase-like Zn-dependent oxidoreductase